MTWFWGKSFKVQSIYDILKVKYYFNSTQNKKRNGLQKLSNLFANCSHYISMCTNWIIMSQGASQQTFKLFHYFFSLKRRIRTSFHRSWLFIYHHEAHMPNLDNFGAWFPLWGILGSYNFPPWRILGSK